MWIPTRSSGSGRLSTFLQPAIPAEKSLWPTDPNLGTETLT
jgi:hypothetical protein